MNEKTPLDLHSAKAMASGAIAAGGVLILIYHFILPAIADIVSAILFVTVLTILLRAGGK